MKMIQLKLPTEVAQKGTLLVSSIHNITTLLYRKREIAVIMVRVRSCQSIYIDFLLIFISEFSQFLLTEVSKNFSIVNVMALNLEFNCIKNHPNYIKNSKDLVRIPNSIF